MWLVPAIISAFITASKRVYEKTLTGRYGNFTLGFIIQAFSLIPTLFLFLFFPIPIDILHLSWQFWWPLLIIWVILYPVQTYFLYKAIREGELSRTTPIFALLPVLNIFTSYFLLGELPTRLGFTGLIFIVVGTYLLLRGETKDTKKEIYWPVIFMIISVSCMAIGTALDKISVKASTPVFYSFVNSLGATIIFLILMYIYKQNHEFKGIKKEFGAFTLLGISQAVSYTAFIFAISVGTVSYVLAVKSGSYILAAIFSIFFFKEKLTNRKIIALILFIVGILCLAV